MDRTNELEDVALGAPVPSVPVVVEPVSTPWNELPSDALAKIDAALGIDTTSIRRPSLTLRSEHPSRGTIVASGTSADHLLRPLPVGWGPRGMLCAMSAILLGGVAGTLISWYVTTTWFV